MIALRRFPVLTGVMVALVLVLGGLDGGWFHVLAVVLAAIAALLAHRVALERRGGEAAHGVSYPGRIPPERVRPVVPRVRQHGVRGWSVPARIHEGGAG